MANDFHSWLVNQMTPRTSTTKPWYSPYWTPEWLQKWYKAYLPGTTSGWEGVGGGSAQAKGVAALATLAIPFLTPIDMGTVLKSLAGMYPEMTPEQKAQIDSMLGAANWVGWANTQRRTSRQYERAYLAEERLQKMRQILNMLEEGPSEQTGDFGVAWQSLPKAVRDWVHRVLQTAASFYSNRRTYAEQLEYLSGMQQLLSTAFPQPNANAGEATANAETIPGEYVQQIAEILRRLVLPTLVGPSWGQTGMTPIGVQQVQGYWGRGGWY